MKRRPEMDTSCAVPAVPGRPVSAALALGLALALGAAGDAAAQTCRGDDPTNKAQRINCQEGSSSSANIVVDASNLAIAETGSDDAVTAFNEGSGSVSVTVTASTLSMTGNAWVIYGSADNNDMDLTVTQSTLTTSGWVDSAVFGFAEGSGTVSIDFDQVTLTASGRTNDAIRANNRGSGAIDIDITGGTITASASGHDETLRGVHATHQGTGGIDIDIDGGAVIETTGRRRASAIWAQIQDTRPANAGTIRIRMTGGSLSTTGTRAGTGLGSEETYSYGVGAYHENAGGLIDIGLDGVTVTTTGDYSSAVHGEHERSGAINVALTGSTLSTAGTGAHGVDTVTQGAVDIDVTGGSITTAGATAHGVYARNTGSAGAVSITLDGAVVTTRGTGAHGVWGSITHGSNEAALTVGVTGGAVTAEGRDVEAGVVARHAGLGSIALTVGAGAKIRAPFSIGAEGRLTSNANAAGRLVVTHGGTVEARDAGVVAWAARRSGHTSGAGANEADDADRTEPMIHVTSSGDVTVGGAATDAFIRAAIAGEDETLAAAEKAVYDAIVAEDSGALDTALAALPASYDAAWKARARALSDKRGHAPTDAETLANRAAEEILGLTRAGIRALALSHEAIAGHVRNGDGDGALSAAERTVLAAALTGGDLTAALAALSATYTDGWKDTLRELAASYNGGDIRVDVTGGTITAEGDGVDARYALTHDRNGAIAVTVADGASVSGGRHGLYVGGAGLVEGSSSLRGQTVTVDGAVMGGTGAGVHLAGGGTVTVGRSGRVGARSGDGIVSEGGDLAVTVAGTVGGDVRATGGDLTFASLAGSSVTGTIHDPASPLTVHGSVGRLLYSAGGTVTVAATGRITGVEGETDGIRSASGDLSVTVAGTVEGDIRAEGGGELVVVIVDPGETGSGALRIQGRIVETGGTPRVLFQPSGSTQRMELLAGRLPAPSGAWDVGVVQEGSDGSRLRLEREYGPRTRVYEALPSVLLGLNGLARFEERMAAARTERGGWARVEASRGEWEADSSTTGVEYTHRRSGLRAGLDVAAGEKGVLGVSVHHRLGSADVSRGGGVKLTGSGAGVSGTWLGDDAYVDVQAEVTWYEADASSMSRGTLKKEASGRGHALGVEVGRRVSMPALAEGVVFTPRAGLVHSRVSVDDFTDALGTRVTVDEARSLKGRVGVLLEAEPGGSPNRVSGSLDVEHEFSGDMKVRVSGVEMTPEAEATWVRVGLNGSHAWDDGRYTLRGGVSYARSGESYEVGGGVSLEVRF